VGVGRSGASNKKYVQKKADEIKAVSLQSALDTVQKLEGKLTEFAKRHQADIQNDPVFRQRFLQMCGPLGVDPLSSQKTMWGNLLGGMGDYYHELALKVAEVCLASRSRNGGIISVTEVQRKLQQRTTRFNISDSNSKKKKIPKSDLQVAIQKLGKLGGGFRTVDVGSSTMIVSVPTELDQDHMQVLTAAQQLDGCTGLTVDDVVRSTGWGAERVERALELLLQEGMAWLDVHQGRTYYWITSLWQESQEKEKGEIEDE
jgi:ESCRT-II complex subunit VPS22